MNVVETSRLGKNYGSNWVLRDCTLSIPTQRIVGLVGPNGAGKTTLLHCVVGLTNPTEGAVRVLGGRSAGALDVLERIAFVAQDAPLYNHLSVEVMVEVAQNLNRRFDSTDALARLQLLDINLRQKVGSLSGGQQAQLALTLALARRPELLVLDEPLARLDPLARHNFMAMVMSSVAENGLSVIFSSHVVSELERVADYLVVLASGRLQMCGSIDTLLMQHAFLRGPVEQLVNVSQRFGVVQSRLVGSRAELIVRSSHASTVPQGWDVDDISLEELILAYLRQPESSMMATPLTIAAAYASGASL